MCKKETLFIFDDYFFCGVCGIKRVLFKVNLFTQNVGLLKRIHFFFSILFDKQRRNLLQKILFTQQEKVFANTDFICDVLLYKKRVFLGRDVISRFHCTTQNSPSSSAGKTRKLAKASSLLRRTSCI